MAEDAGFFLIIFCVLRTLRYQEALHCNSRYSRIIQIIQEE